MAVIDGTNLGHLWGKVKALVDAHKADVTQTLTSGTEIGSVDGTKLYAPAGGGGGSVTTWYGTCGTTASTAAKVVTCADFSLEKGAIIGVLFTAANTAATPTLNVNGTGPTSIYIGAATVNATTNALKWSANTMLWFQYDGTYFRYMSAQAGAAVQHPDGAGAWYGTCATASATAAKVVTCADFRLTRGAVITVNFSGGSYVTSGAMTLNVNSTGAKTVYYKGMATTASNALRIPSSGTATFIYSGSYWYLLSTAFDTGWVELVANVWYRVKDGFCTIAADGVYTTPTTSGWVSVAQLPDACRPSRTLRFIWYDHARSEFRRGQVTTSDLAVVSSGNADGCEFTFTYPVG